MGLELRRLTREKVIEGTIEVLGFDAKERSIMSREVLSSLVRRSAALICPSSKYKLINSIIESLKLLIEQDISVLEEKLNEVVEGMIALGDLIENKKMEEYGETNQNVLYANQPCFIVRDSGDIIFIGIYFLYSRLLCYFIWFY